MQYGNIPIVKQIANMWECQVREAYYASTGTAPTHGFVLNREGGRLKEVDLLDKKDRLVIEVKRAKNIVLFKQNIDKYIYEAQFAESALSRLTDEKWSTVILVIVNKEFCEPSLRQQVLDYELSDLRYFAAGQKVFYVDRESVKKWKKKELPPETRVKQKIKSWQAEEEGYVIQL